VLKLTQCMMRDESLLLLMLLLYFLYMYTIILFRKCQLGVLINGPGEVVYCSRCC